MKKQTLIEQSLETLKNNGFKYTKKREEIFSTKKSATKDNILSTYKIQIDLKK